MPAEILDRGRYELFETTRGNRILVLKDDKWFAWVEGQAGEILVHSDSGHKKSKTLQKGGFFLVDFRDDPKFTDHPHLFLEKRGKYQDAVVPQGLPDSRDHQKKVATSHETIGKSELEDYLERPAEAGPGAEKMGRPGGGSMSNVTYYLSGVDFPAGREEAISRARENGAPHDVIEQVEKLPGRKKFKTMAELTAAIGERTWQPPIENYDRLKVGDIEKQVDSLSKDDARQLMEYEAQNKDRKTLRQAFERKLSAR